MITILEMTSIVEVTTIEMNTRIKSWNKAGKLFQMDENRYLQCSSVRKICGIDMRNPAATITTDGMSLKEHSSGT